MTTDRLSMLDHIIFCAGCRQYIRPEIIADTTTKEEQVQSVARTDVFDLEDDATIEFKSQEPIYGYFDQENQILRCPIANCGKKYLRIYPNLKGEQEIIPLSEDWFKNPIDNPQENGKKIIPEIPYQVYHECIKAFNNSLPISCAFLLGAVMESLCIELKIKEKLINKEKDKRIKQGNYKSGDFILIKLKDMVPILIQEKNLDDDYGQLIATLSKVRNDAVHEIIQLEREELSAGIKSIEILFEELFLEDFLRRKRKRISQENKRIMDSGLKNKKDRHEN